VVEVEQLTKHYSREVLNIECLALRRGRIYGIMGPSGVGKSTLLRILNLLEPPSSGVLRFDGRPFSGNGRERLARQRKMTMVSQKPLLFKSSVWDNVAFGLRARGCGKRQIHRKVDLLLEQVGLSELSRQHAATLSGGEAQRAALARAVAFEPELLLLDEPTANLDPANVEMIEKMILELNRATGITIAVVTHNVFQARRIAGEVVFLYEGRVVETGKAEEVFSAPRDPRTRAFIEGRMIY
jgi:tungstate transport system ATP-binding protein